MIKECDVILHNEKVAVVLFDGRKIQVPSNELIGKTAYVKFENEKYTVVSKKEKETEEAEKIYCSKKKNKKETKGENNFIVTENLTESIVEKIDDIVMDNEEINE